ncbi:hypothetical protein [Streptomyces sp. NBC_01565]|uniref:hypothetical protein n=1 Tax=Streptomyces sp. NBC_01565 TaxID=2975881 RepID=UPI00224DFCE8|nr:hypothetical protein [Streptomyces sp. NBC_01565]MCX4547193.1 hypothetical protein [Streptomyces sp. NBC_01565]MCX4547207.1 hypothetical protein [Streptomyces sp. NBC_01565]
MTNDRCAAAHTEDPTPCEGPHDAVLIRDRQTTTGGVPGCVHHGARMLASLEGGRVYPGPSAGVGRTPESGGAAVDAYNRAQTLQPFPWMSDPQDSDS